MLNDHVKKNSLIFKLKREISPGQKPLNAGKFLTKSVPDFKLSFARFNAIGVGSSDQAGSSKQGKERKTDEEEDEDWSQLEKAVLDEKDYDEEDDDDFK